MGEDLNNNKYFKMFRKIKNDENLEQLIKNIEKKCPFEDIGLLHHAADLRRYELIRLKEEI